MNHKKLTAGFVAAALCISLVVPSETQAAKKPKLSKTKITLSVKETKKVSIKNVKATKIKKLVVKSSKKKIATVKKNGKTAFSVTGKKAGNATITAKVQVKGKKSPTSLKLKVTVKKASDISQTQSDKTAAPVVTVAPTPTGTPASGSQNTPTPSQIPETPKPAPENPQSILEAYSDIFPYLGNCANYGNGQLTNEKTSAFIKKHFNSFTLENEMKPSYVLGYSATKISKEQATKKGYTIPDNYTEDYVPQLNFDTLDKVLQVAYDNNLKMRGHTLVWHSQTPEWFFREGYTVGQKADGSENYVTPEVMNLRMEWYIKTVLEHYTGENSPYKDLFYGWDVVNEEVNNGGRGYRTEKVSAIEPLSQSTHGSKSSWWAVYQSNEYIINAFRFANKYAPADLELYYNDYNESDSSKVKDIVTLLTDVKEAEGTRIDGMGMQGHYKLSDPKLSDIEKAIRAYAAVVGQVQFTELDMKASTDITSEEVLAEEYEKQAEHYHDIYMLLQKLDAEDGIEIGGITFWGTVDKYSWLQSRSSVGGGSDGLLPQCPLLFDSNYRVKPAYWAFVDYSMVNPDWNKETEEPEVAEDTQEESAEEASEPEPVVAEPEAEVTEKKSSPFVPIAVAVGVVAVAAVAGTAVFFGKRKKGVGGQPTE